MSVYYGASYSPLVFPESEWANELRHMQTAGMNLLRIGDVHGSWDRIEPQEKQYQLDVLERFYVVAAKFDISILLSTGASCPPLWLATKHPDVVILSNSGQRYPMAASYHWACIHHPAFREASDRYLDTLVDFALAQPNHFGWQISNEIGFPFLPTFQKAELELYCYCSHCRQEFRQWVQDKYQALEAVNEAWMWGTTAFWYNDWQEIAPPESKPNAWSGVTRWLDWRLFWQAMFVRFAKHQHDRIRQKDLDHPTSVNTFSFKGYDRFGTFTGLDQWKMAHAVDHIGYDLYPGSGNKLAGRPEHNSIFLDHGRSVCRTTGRDFWLHELESGPIGGWVMGPDYNTGPVDIWRNGVEALGHDVKIILFMPWREWDYQPLHWGALVDLDGQPTPRLTAAGELGRYIHRNSDFLKAARVPQGEVALLTSKDNAIFLRGVDEEERLFAAQRGAYRALWELDYRIDFITPDQVLDGPINAYKVIVLPLMALIDLETSMALQNYVANGGLLVGFARCGTLNKRGWYHRHLPMPGLREAFGLSHIEADSPPVPPIQFGGQTYNSFLNRDIVRPQQGTQRIAQFADGLPAITLAQHGKGYGLYIATQADSSYVQSDDGLLKNVLADVLSRLNQSPTLQLIYDGREIRELDAHLLETENRSTILVANYLKRDTDIKMILAVNGREPSTVEAGFNKEKQKVTWHMSNGKIVIQLPVLKDTPLIVDIHW